MFRKILQVEIIKLQKSLIVLLIIVCPLIVVLLNLGIMMKQTNVKTFEVSHWRFFWIGIQNLWCYFMQPLFIALVTTLINGQEHKNHTWRVMLTMPINKVELFLTKLIVAWITLLAANIALIGFGGLLMITLSAFGFPLSLVHLSLPLILLGALSMTLACLPILTIQHAISWRSSSLTLPLAIGVIATMGVLQIGSSEYWVYHPWTYALMAINGGTPSLKAMAYALSIGIGSGLVFLTALWLGKRGMRT